MKSAKELIFDRLKEGSTPGDRSDDFRLVLAIEGGGMRSVVSAGMALALEQLGMTKVFDSVVGTSAGALIGAYFIAGKATSSAAIYYKDVSKKPFLDTSKLLKLAPAMDLDYLLNDICVNKRPLDTSKINESLIALHATVTPIDPEGETLFKVEGSDARIRSILAASACLPIIGGPAREVDDGYFVDGGLLEPIPLWSAAQLGATHVLVLPSRRIHPDSDSTSAGFIAKYAAPRLLKLRFDSRIASLSKTMEFRSFEMQKALYHTSRGASSLLLKTDSGSFTGFSGNVEFVQVDEVNLPDTMGTDRVELVEGMHTGAQALLDHFDLGDIEVEQRVVLTHPEVQVLQFRSARLSSLVASTPLD